MALGAHSPFAIHHSPFTIPQSPFPILHPTMSFPRISTLKTAEQFSQRLSQLGLDLPFDSVVQSGATSPLAQPLSSVCGPIGNRWCILPMEGWDGTLDGRPTDLTRRRWTRFGLSGAKLMWGCEAVAVRFDGRANPNQLVISADTLADLAELRQLLVDTHAQSCGDTSDLLVGLQLTHSGRFARPFPGKPLQPAIAWRHPLLDKRFGIDSDEALLTDDDLRQLTDDFISAAKLAQRAGFTWVDIKHCHGYLGHELLSGFDRPGAFGGSFENRTRFLRDIVSGIRASAPGLGIGVRLSVFDFVPFQPGTDAARTGVPSMEGPYPHAFGGDGTGHGMDPQEPFRFLQLLTDLGIDLFCSTCGSPYYNPHIQRPALFPPSDGYQPPEDPLVGVTRQIQATALLKSRFPKLITVGSGYSYLQEWLPNVGQAVVRLGMADSIGLGRMVLSYPDLPADSLAGRPMQRKQICRTFSDCTTAPRNGMVSGCYPLDPLYKSRPERDRLAACKSAVSAADQHSPD
jgi:2,4-dienoyl-CoA reductase-like NADH-dependent reductase (Old Yellow Enzyme family)